MDDTLKLGFSQAQAADRRRMYRTVLGMVLGLQVLLGVAGLLGPHTLSGLLGLPEPYPVAWVRAWGALVLLLVVLYVPGWMDPLRARWPNLAGILGRLGLGIVYLALGGGFAVLGVIELALALLLAWLYLNVLKAELMSRP